MVLKQKFFRKLGINSISLLFIYENIPFCFRKEETEELNEEQEIDDAVKAAEELELSKLQEAKRKKKKILKERRKLHERLNLKMIIKDDEPIIDEDRELFALSQIKNPKVNIYTL